MRMCLRCNKPVPKKRIRREGYSSLFCTSKCHVRYADEILDKLRASELDAQRDMERLGYEPGSWRSLFRSLNGESGVGRTPEEVAAMFLGTAAGHFASRVIDGELGGRVREWARTILRKALRPPGGAGRSEGCGAAHHPPPGRRPQPRVAPPPVQDLGSLPLREQRAVLMSRFRRLPPDATFDDVRKEYRRLVKIYHPDVMGTGNLRMFVHVDTTFKRLEEIEKQLAGDGAKTSGRQQKDKVDSQ